MFFFVLVFVALCGSVQVTSEQYADNYNIISTMLKSPVRRESFSSSSSDKKITTGNLESNLIDKDYTDSEDEREHEHTTECTINEHAEESEATTTPESNVEEESQRSSSTQPSAVKEGFLKVKSLYEQCNNKINKRINKLLRTNINVKTNTEKDLFELKEYVLSLYRCMKVSGFRYLDEVLKGDVIPVTDYVDFVRDGRGLKDSPIVNVIPMVLNGKLSFRKEAAGAQKNMTTYVSHILQNDWNELLLERFGRLLDSHTLKFYIDDETVQARGRRRDQRMFAMMVMGFMIMSTILIPMGFQFLTVLGGKSLLMAKMALIMSAINGLKKIATSQVGYGFYHTAPDGYHHDHHHHGFHDKVFQIKPDEQPLPFQVAV